MIKKVITLLLILITLIGCSNKTEVNYTYDIQSKPVDMSSYDRVNSTDHMFKAITVQELFNCIDNKSSAVFYLGRTNCGCCQTTVMYLDEAAKQANVTIYYMDVYNEQMPITDKEIADKLKLYMFDILYINEDGKRELQTPTVFNVVNGEIKDSLICLGNLAWDDEPTEAQKNQLINKYREIFKPFSK